MAINTFIVDASLLNELGERLIGRPGIALGELIKNAFDADATVCRIEFGEDQIVVSDNGSGMSEEDFLKHWMRIGTIHKVQERISRKFKRPLTGSKGIGRLSAQFLAHGTDTRQQVDQRTCERYSCLRGLAICCKRRRTQHSHRGMESKGEGSFVPKRQPNRNAHPPSGSQERVG